MEHGAMASRGVLARPQPASPYPADRYPDSASADGGGPGTVRTHRARRPGGRVAAWLPLLAVLAAQAVLSVRLIRADTAFQDEAAYLWAGHLDWAHWLHGTPIPPFSSYFSGAPVIYPALAAVADSAGGLAGARLLSLAFMLGTTVLLWDAAGRLYGRRAAFFAAALFAAGGPTLHLGSFATYDAMSLLLVALAAWCVIRAGDRREAIGWMTAAGVSLALANATTYSSVLLDPVVILLALLAAFPRPGGRAGAGRAGLVLAVTAGLLTASLLLSGSGYVSGVRQTTLARLGGASSPLTVLTDAWTWTGVIIVLAACGLLISLAARAPRAQTVLLALLTLAALLGPLEQAHLHTTASLTKHIDLGAWFAAIAAGYAADRLVASAAAGRMRALACGACVIALAFPIALGATQSEAFATDWPDSAGFTAILRPLAGQAGGRLLVEDPSVAEYYLAGIGRQWQRWSSTRNISLPGGLSTGGPAAGITGPGNAGVFAEFITRGYFSLVALNFSDTTRLDHQLAADLRQNHRYHIVQVIPYGNGPAGPAPGTYIIWQYEPRP